MQDPHICKLDHERALANEVNAHRVFAVTIGSSMPSLGEPVYHEGAVGGGKVGGVLLELVGACWQVPELAQTKTKLSCNLAELVMWESLHAGEQVAGLSRPVFGEVRPVLDEIVLEQLGQVIAATAKRSPSSLGEHYGLRWRVSEVVLKQDNATDEIAKLKERFPKEVSDREVRYPLPEEQLEQLRSLMGAMDAVENFRGTDDGLWFGVTHNDLHGGNIMVDSRSFAWLIDYGEVEAEGGHVMKVRFQLERVINGSHTTAHPTFGLALLASKVGSLDAGSGKDGELHSLHVHSTTNHAR